MCYQTKLNAQLLKNKLSVSKLEVINVEKNILSIIRTYEMKQQKDIDFLLKKITVKKDDKGINCVIINEADLSYMKEIISKGD